MRAFELREEYYDYADIGIETEPAPAKSGDVYRVFHGFYSLNEAIHAATRGLSGRQRAARRYSYENNNNPYGIFVTLNFKVAREFVGGFTDRAILEFNARYDDLEPPVWPSGSYTVQGGREAYFSGHPGTAQHRRSRNAAMKQAELRTQDAQHIPDFIKQSHSPYKASMLFQGREYQALFVGDLAPGDMTCMWVQKKDGKDPVYSKQSWERLSISEFLDQYTADPEHEGKNEGKLFLPTDTFSPEAFITAIMNKQGNVLDLNGVLERWAEDIWRSKDKKHAFINIFDRYLWPRQYADAFRWLLRTYTKDK
jgi:hypothetical protein